MSERAFGTYPGPYRPCPGPYRGRSPEPASRPWWARLLPAGLAALLAGGLLGVTPVVLPGTPAQPDVVTSPSPRLPARPTPITIPPVTPVSAMVEGRDYSFLARANGRPIAWAEARTITIGFVDPTDRASWDAVRDAVALLQPHTRLSLVVTQGSALDITLVYVPVLSTDADSKVLGTARPQWDVDGTIVSARIELLGTLDPSSVQTRRVIAHELGHSLGLGHAVEGADELMAPSAVPDAPFALGDGDLTALAELDTHARIAA